jgi:hypothetical protein
MSDSIRTICRLALVAVGLTLGSPAAYAATATIDCGNGTPTWNASTNTLSCQVGSKCTISGPTSAIVNNLFTLTASCPSGSTYTWTGGAATSCTGASCDITETVTGNKSYTVATETTGSVSNIYTVNITSGAVAPSGCSLSASPSTGPSGSNVTLTANCTSGTMPITIAWGGASGTGSCPTSINGSAVTCAVNNVTANSTWTASFSNSGGNFANNPRSAAFSIQSGGGGAFAGCPAGTVTIDGQWGNTAIDTAQWGEFGGNIVSIRLVPPATMSGTITSSWGEYGAAPALREAVLSTSPCSFDNATVLKNGYGQTQHFFVNGPSFKYRLGSAGGFAAGVTAGTSYYINIRNRDAAGNLTCTISDCRMRGGLPQ